MRRVGPGGPLGAQRQSTLPVVRPEKTRRPAVPRERQLGLDAEGNLVVCRARRVRADEADRLVVDALIEFRQADAHLDAVRDELLRRRKAHKPGDMDRQRERLKRAEVALLEQHRHGYIHDETLHREMTSVRRQLAAMPASDDKVVVFDDYRQAVRSFAEIVAAASPEQLRELVALVVERVETADRAVARVVWTPPARPFFLAAAAEAEQRAL